MCTETKPKMINIGAFNVYNELLNEWEVAVEGRHTYLGRLGHEYRKRPFRAVILLHKGTEDTFTITFEKQSENQLMNTTYWEDTTQIFRYKR